MKRKLISMLSLTLLAFTVAHAQGNWETTSQNSITNAATVSSGSTITAEGIFTWTSSKSFMNDKHLAQLNFALPTGVVVASGTPAVFFDNNVPVQGAFFTMNSGGWVCNFAPGTVFAPGAKLTFKVSGLELKDDKAYTHQQLTNFISFVASPGAESYTDNSSTESFNTTVNGPLPIQLLDFRANLVDVSAGKAKVRLNWETSSEKNSGNFLVQRSANTTDWEEVLNVKAKGNSNIQVNYEDIDNNPFVGTSFYRLKQFDLNGEFTYSKVRTVTWNRDNGQISLFPNPTRDILNVEYALDAKALVEIKVMTAEGRVAKGIMAYGEKGLNTVKMDIGELANAVYNVSVYENNELISTGKIQKK